MYNKIAVRRKISTKSNSYKHYKIQQEAQLPQRDPRDAFCPTVVGLQITAQHILCVSLMSTFNNCHVSCVAYAPRYWRQTTPTDDDRHQRSLLVLPPSYTTVIALQWLKLTLASN